MKSQKKSKKKITYGKVNLDKDEFAPENIKVCVSLMIPHEVLIEIKKLAKSSGLPYKNYINQVLREHACVDAQKRRIKDVLKKVVSKAP